ncbi:MAG: hypothetical protein ACI97A_000304 [Planctomycetota bacterium]|jgi:hypothetical protein
MPDPTSPRVFEEFAGWASTNGGAIFGSVLVLLGLIVLLIIISGRSRLSESAREPGDSDDKKSDAEGPD